MKDRHEQTRDGGRGSGERRRPELHRDRHRYDSHYQHRTDSRRCVTGEVTCRYDVFGNRISMKLHVPRRKWVRSERVRVPRTVVAALDDDVQEVGPPQSPQSPQSPTYSSDADAPGSGGAKPPDRSEEHYDSWGGFKPAYKKKKKSRGSRRKYYCPSVNAQCYLLGKLEQVLLHVNKERHGVGGRTYTEDDQALLTQRPVSRGQQFPQTSSPLCGATQVVRAAGGPQAGR